MNLMKKILFALSAATVMVACNTNPGTAAADQATVTTVDTTGFAQFQAFKQQQAFLAAQAAAPAVRTVTRYVPVRSASTARSYSSSAAPVAMTSESSNAAKSKRGISKAAKGAIIGGVAGAAGGAIINKKNRGVGAVIGGVLGAGAGYGIGRGMDKKDGRY
jgi:hypothetical protein